MKPERFPFSGMFAAFFALLMTLVLVTLPAEVPLSSVARGAAGVLAALSIVAAEALWRPRPWAYRASAALALANILSALVVCTLMMGVNGLGLACGYIFFSSVVVVPILAAVYQGTIASTGVPPRPRPVPAPVAVPAPGVAP